MAGLWWVGKGGDPWRPAPPPPEQMFFGSGECKNAPEVLTGLFPTSIYADLAQ
jgi:hypothetical protein